MTENVQPWHRFALSECLLINLNAIGLQWSASGQFYREIFTDQMIIGEDDDNVDFEFCSNEHNIK